MTKEQLIQSIINILTNTFDDFRQKQTELGLAELGFNINNKTMANYLNEILPFEKQNIEDHLANERNFRLDPTECQSGRMFRFNVHRLFQSDISKLIFAFYLYEKHYKECFVGFSFEKLYKKFFFMNEHNLPQNWYYLYFDIRNETPQVVGYYLLPITKVQINGRDIFCLDNQVAVLTGCDINFAIETAPILMMIYLNKRYPNITGFLSGVMINPYTLKKCQRILPEGPQGQGSLELGLPKCFYPLYDELENPNLNNFIEQLAMALGLIHDNEDAPYVWATGNRLLPSALKDKILKDKSPSTVHFIYQTGFSNDLSIPSKGVFVLFPFTQSAFDLYKSMVADFKDTLTRALKNSSLVLDPELSAGGMGKSKLDPNEIIDPKLQSEVTQLISMFEVEKAYKASTAVNVAKYLTESTFGGILTSPLYPKRKKGLPQSTEFPRAKL